MTNHEISKLDRGEVKCYRGTEQGTSIYMKNGEVHYVLQSFDEVDSILELTT